MQRTQAIKEFLAKNCSKHIAGLYHAGMEVQVNVQSFGLEKKQTTLDNGKKWSFFEDGRSRWWDIRIPHNSKLGPPEYDLEKDMPYALGKYADGICLTGWNFGELETNWVAFDLDSVRNHAGCGVEDDELERIVEALKAIPWVTIWRSKSGHGYHFIVFLRNSPRVKNHTEHAAIAKAILNHLAAITGISLSASMDACGTTHFIWHQNTGERGFELIQMGEPLDEVPNGWQALLEQRLNKRRAPMSVKNVEAFDKVDAMNTRVALDYKHRQVIHELERLGAMWWWDADNWLLVCHTTDLAKIHASLELKGNFSTASSHSTDQNCFMFPMANGSWIIRRYGKVNESEDWEQLNEWAVIYFNRVPAITEVLNKLKAGRDRGKWLLTREHFTKLISTYKIPGTSPFEGRQHKLTTADDTFIVKVRVEDGDDEKDTSDWTRDNNYWTFDSRFEVANYTQNTNTNDVIRYAHDPIKEKYNQYIWNQPTKTWRGSSESNCRNILAKDGIVGPAAAAVLGDLTHAAPHLIKIPFAPEYHNGGWNKYGATLAFTPNFQGNGFAPTWDSIFTHLGKRLTPLVEKNQWCKEHGIRTGGQWLKYWTAFMLREPWRKEPMVFLYSPEQNTGKSTLKDALRLLMHNGHVDCAAALSRVQGNSTAFAGELVGMVLGYVEEKNLGGSKALYDHLKGLITDEEMSIEPKGGTPVLVKNYLHIIHTAQSAERAAVGTGDTRIQMIEVEPLGDKYVDSTTFKERLIEEAPDFMAEMMSLPLPERNIQRFTLPILTDSDKEVLMVSREEDIDAFLRELCHDVPGAKEKLSELYEAYTVWLARNNVMKKPTQRHFKALLASARYPVGKHGGAQCVGNITLDPKEKTHDQEFVQNDNRLVMKKVIS